MAQKAPKKRAKTDTKQREEKYTQKQIRQGAFRQKPDCPLLLDLLLKRLTPRIKPTSIAVPALPVIRRPLGVTRRLEHAVLNF